MASPNSPGESSLIEVRPPEELTRRLSGELQKLQGLSGFVSAAIARRDGLPIYHTFQSPRAATGLCATAAAIVGASLSAGRELAADGFLHGVVQYEGSAMVLAEAGPDAVVACLLRPESNVGLALLTIRSVASAVEEVLEEV